MKYENIFSQSDPNTVSGQWANRHAAVPKIKGFPSVQNKYENIFIFYFCLK